MPGRIKVGIREREVEGKLFRSGTVLVRYLYPFALEGFLVERLNKPNPYSIIYIERHLCSNGR